MCVCVCECIHTHRYVLLLFNFCNCPLYFFPKTFSWKQITIMKHNWTSERQSIWFPFFLFKALKPECKLVWPFKVGDVLVVALAADVDDLGEELVSVGGSFRFVHVQHQLLHNLHQVLFGHLGGTTVLLQLRMRPEVNFIAPVREHVILDSATAAAWTGVLTMPYSRSRALRRMDSSLSSRHCRMRSLWDWTDLGWVFRIFDIASRPRYFTWKTKTPQKHVTDTCISSQLLQLHPIILAPIALWITC